MLGGAIGRDISVACQSGSRGNVDDARALAEGFQVRQRRFVTLNTPVRSTPITFSQRSSSVFSKGALGASPALLTRIETGPNFARAFSNRPQSPRYSSHRNRKGRTRSQHPAPAPGLQRLGPPSGQRQQRPLARKPAGNGRPDAAAGAGDENVPVFKRSGHVSLTLPVLPHGRGSPRTDTCPTCTAWATRRSSGRSWPPRAAPRRGLRDADGRQRKGRRGRRR